MIHHVRLVAILAGTLASGVGFAQPTGTPLLGTVHLPRAVMANGQPLAAGTYQVRVTSDQPAPVVGEAPGSECWVEFTKAGKTAGKEVATVISQRDIGSIAKGPRPAAGTPSVELLKGDQYLRVWIVHGDNNYLVNLRIPAH